jgi:hypothetical protein
MPKFNASQMQKKYSVNRSTVGRWISAGKLISDQDGYFEESDFLVLFRKSKAWNVWRDKQKQDELSKSTVQLPLEHKNQLNGSVDHDSNMDQYPTKSFANESDLNKLDLSNLKLKEDIKEKRRKNAMAEGRLINRTLVKRFIGRMGEIDNTEWRSLSSRIAGDLMAICGVNESKYLTEINKRIDEEVFDILSSVQRSQKEFLESLDVET